MEVYEVEIALRMMGLTKIGRPDSMGNQSVTCPLAPWTHRKGKDKRPSMTIKAGTPALFKCWSCHNQGSIKKLANLYSEYSGDTEPYEYVRKRESGEDPDIWNDIHEGKYDHKKRNVGPNARQVTEKDLEMYLKNIPQYALDRGLTREQIMKWEIGYDIPRRRMIIPVRDYYNEFMGVSGRDVTGEGNPKYKHYPGLMKDRVFYGENHIDQNESRAYIVEGFFDVWGLERRGLKNVLGTMGTSLSDDKMKNLALWFTEIVFIPDCDDDGAGLRFVQEYGKILFLEHRLKVGVAGVWENPQYTPREKPRIWQNYDYKFLPLDILKDKDPADLDDEEVRDLVDSVVWFDLEGRL